jgi:hypothetical protein
LNAPVSELSCVEGLLVMRVIAVLAALSVALLPLGGCFFHHNQAVVAQPLPPLK